MVDDVGMVFPLNDRKPGTYLAVPRCAFVVKLYHLWGVLDLIVGQVFTKITSDSNNSFFQWGYTVGVMSDSIVQFNGLMFGTSYVIL